MTCITATSGWNQWLGDVWCHWIVGFHLASEISWLFNFLIISLWKYNSYYHKILPLKYIGIKCVCRIFFFCRVMQPSLLRSLRTFSSPPKETLDLLVVHPFVPPHQAPGAAMLLSNSLNLLILDISLKRNHKIGVLLLLAPFTERVFKVHSCWSTQQYFIAFHAE